MHRWCSTCPNVSRHGALLHPLGNSGTRCQLAKWSQDVQDRSRCAAAVQNRSRRVADEASLSLSSASPSRDQAPRAYQRASAPCAWSSKCPCSVAGRGVLCRRRSERRARLPPSPRRRRRVHAVLLLWATNPGVVGSARISPARSSSHAMASTASSAACAASRRRLLPRVFLTLVCVRHANKGREAVRHRFATNATLCS